MLTTRRNSRRRLSVLVCAAVLALGCGDGRVRVRGTVLFAGVPLEEGAIAFEPADGRGPTTGGAVAGGKYDLTGDARAIPGEKVVRIIGTSGTGKLTRVPSPAPAGALVERRVQCIPREYNDRSTLRVTLTAGAENVRNFDLKPAAKR